MNLGAYAHGTIEPQPRIDAGDITEAEVNAFVDALNGDEFYGTIDNFMPKCCVDGRHRADGACQLGANAAGGVFSLLVADMLTTQTFRHGAADTATYALHVFERLNAICLGEFGDHDADQTAQNDDCGCGAIDKMAAVLTLLARNGQELCALASAAGIAIADEDAATVIGRAQEIVQQRGFRVATGRDMLAALKKAAGHDSVETLTDAHNEVAVVVNEREGTTLNRAKIKARYGNRLQAFNYDRWAMRKAVRAIAREGDEDEARLKLAAADMYNLAVTCTLAGPSLRAVVRSAETPIAA